MVSELALFALLVVGPALGSTGYAAARGLLGQYSLSLVPDLEAAIDAGWAPIAATPGGEDPEEAGVGAVRP